MWWRVCKMRARACVYVATASKALVGCSRTRSLTQSWSPMLPTQSHAPHACGPPSSLARAHKLDHDHGIVAPVAPVAARVGCVCSLAHSHSLTHTPSSAPSDKTISSDLRVYTRMLLNLFRFYFSKYIASARQRYGNEHRCMYVRSYVLFCITHTHTAGAMRKSLYTCVGHRRHEHTTYTHKHLLIPANRICTCASAWLIIRRNEIK